MTNLCLKWITCSHSSLFVWIYMQLYTGKDVCICIYCDGKYHNILSLFKMNHLPHSTCGSLWMCTYTRLRMCFSCTSCLFFKWITCNHIARAAAAVCVRICTYAQVHTRVSAYFLPLFKMNHLPHSSCCMSTFMYVYTVLFVCICIHKSYLYSKLILHLHFTFLHILKMYV